MKNIKKMLVVAGCAAALCLSAGNVMAQRGGGGGGNFDPAQMRQNRLDRVREQMDVKDDSEWKVLETSIGKVMDAQQEAMQGRFGGMGGGRGNRQRGGAGGNNANPTAADTTAGGQGGGNQARRGGPAPSAEMEDLQKAIEAKAPADEIKAKLQKVRDVSKAKEAKLETTREDLKKLVTARQEAILVVNGILQ